MKYEKEFIEFMDEIHHNRDYYSRAGIIERIKAKYLALKNKPVIIAGILASHKYNCPMCIVYFKNNLNFNRAVNRYCPSCSAELPDIKYTEDEEDAK